MIHGIIKMNVEVTDDDEFVRRGSERKERIKFSEKMENGLEKVDDEGGQ